MPYAPTYEHQAILAHAVHHHARVLAGPGTGKSATLVALMDRLLGSNPAPRIKLLTFTRAATAELAKKVSDHPAPPLNGLARFTRFRFLYSYETQELAIFRTLFGLQTIGKTARLFIRRSHDGPEFMYEG